MIEKTVIVVSVSAVSSLALSFLAYRYYSKVREERKNVYESEKLLGQYLALHYGKSYEQFTYGLGPKESLDFPVRCALECIKYTEVGCNVNNAPIVSTYRFLPGFCSQARSRVTRYFKIFLKIELEILNSCGHFLDISKVVSYELWFYYKIGI